MPTILRTNILTKFSCLGAECEDTCCQNWSMQVDKATHDLYEQQAPALLESIETAAESPWIMRKNPTTGICVKLDGGLCAIHRDYGDRFLSDACHFYPRITRALGTEVVMTASMSCPEIVRLALSENNPCAMSPWQEERMPSTMKNYLPEGIDQNQALAIHQAFIAATEDTSSSAEHIFLRIASACRSLERIELKSWPVMTSFYLQHADTRIPAAEKNIADPFNLLHALCGLIVASHRRPSPRLHQTIDAMETALSVKLDWDTVRIHTHDDSLTAYTTLETLWQKEAADFFMPVLRRWLQMQMSLALFPFSGLGNTLTERVTIIGVRLAIIKLALLCSYSSLGKVVVQDTVIRVVQSLSRVLDHIGDPEFSLRVYAETGWLNESRMRGLLGV